MKEDDLLPVRVKSRGEYVIGDEAQTLTRDSGGFTRGIVYATAASVLKCTQVFNADLHKIAGALDGGYLEFDSYTEEVNSRYGRPALQIIRDEGVEGYEAIQDEISPNAYLHAALYDMSVMEAANELNTQPQMVVRTEDGFSSYSAGYGSPDVVAAATIGDDGEIRDMDLREFEPDLDWVIDNWKATGGNRRYTRQLSNTEEDVERLEEEFVVEEPEGDLLDSVIKKKDRGFTIHHVRDKEESITEDEDDRLVMFCGSPQALTDGLTRLTIDDGRVKDRYICGNCERFSGE